MPRLPPPPDRPTDPHTDADARAYEVFAQAQDPLDIEAATWVARQRDGLDAQGEAALQRWLDADPRHRPAFEDMAGTLGELQQLPHGEADALKAGLAVPDTGLAPQPASPVTARPARQPERDERHPWWSGLSALVPPATTAALVLAVAGGAWMGWDHWQSLPTFSSRYATARGQQLSVQLPDGSATGGSASGSRLQLDTATQVEASLYRDRRSVHLKEGQAMFTVRADVDRPFVVWAGALRITVVGTRFSVRHLATGPEAGRTVVSVQEGLVRVAPGTPPAAEHAEDRAEAVPPTQELLLTAGQTVAADATGQLGPVGHVAPSAVASWREGRLSFDQTPLAQAIAEFERYGRTGLLVRDPAVAALPVGGSYGLRQWQHFAESLPQVLPVRLVRQGDVTEVVAR